jgi:hypothetical protein
MPPEALKKKEEKEINNFVGFSPVLESSNAQNVWKQGHILSLKSPQQINAMDSGSIQNFIEKNRFLQRI